MNFELTKLDYLSGKKATIYSIYVDDNEVTLFERFLEENMDEYPQEIESLFKTLNSIGKATGYDKEILYRKSRKATGGAKPGEGKLGQNIDALYDGPNKNLRLYLVYCGRGTIILGGGGFKLKSKETQKLQDTPKLKSENYLLRRFVKVFDEALSDREIYYSGNELKGNLEINDYSDDE